MKRSPVEARVHSSGTKSTNVLIRARELVIRTEFTEVSSCEFPLWTSSPVPVEIPHDGSKSFVVRPFSGSVSQKDVSGDFPNIIKFPLYQQQELASLNDFDELPSSMGNTILSKVPFAAVSTVVSGVVDGKLVQSHSVLPLWNDGSAVLVNLDWYDGEPAEGTPDPEWHMCASSGLPVDLGMERLMLASRLPSNATHCRFLIHMTPWLLGARLLQDGGQEAEHRIWKREWHFDDQTQFSGALERIVEGILGRDTLATRAAQ
jgi:hypothetical protein